MTIKDAFALAFDKNDTETNEKDNIVHLTYKFKVTNYKRGEQGGDSHGDDDKTKESEGTASDEMPSLVSILTAALSSPVATALDSKPVKIPFSKCKAKNPWRCKFHGQDYMTVMLSNLLAEKGVTPVKPLVITRLDDDGISKVSYQMDFDVRKEDVDKAREAVLEFGKKEGIELEDDALDDLGKSIDVNYEIDELDPDDEFEDEDFDDDDDKERSEAKEETTKSEEPPKVEVPPKSDEEPSKVTKEDLEKFDKPETTEEKKPAPAHKSVDAVGMLLEASKRITGAAKSINRGIDRGTFSPKESRIDAAEKMRGPLEAMSKAKGLPSAFTERAGALLSSLDAIKASKEGGFKDRIGEIPFFDEATFRSYGEAAGLKTTPKKEESKPTEEAPKKDEFVAPKSVAEGVKMLHELGETKDYLASCAMSSDISDALKADIGRDLEKVDRELSFVKKITDELKAKDEAEDKARKEAAKKSEDDSKKEEEAGETIAGEKASAKKPRSKKGVVSSDTKLVLGKNTMVLDGYTGKDINKAREAAGLAPLEALKHIDTKVRNRTENFRNESKKLAAEYGDPEIDISDPEVFEQVNKNWADTIKKIVNEGQFGSFLEPSHIFQFLDEGKYRVSWGGERVANLSYAYGIAKKDWDEAAISSILLPGRDERAFETNCSDRFGAAFVEWDKDSDLVPCFSACDADEPANQARSKSASEQAYNPTLVSNPTIASLPSFTKGLDTIIKATGHKSPTGKPMPTWVNAIKLLRKGPLDIKDAKDFNNIVNGEDKWKKGMDLFGWNEAPLLGSGTPKKVRAIHISSEKWNKLRSGPSYWAHGTTSYESASAFVRALKDSHGEKLRENGIKIILDGNEVEF